jgi:hypothetical protein
MHLYMETRQAHPKYPKFSRNKPFHSFLPDSKWGLKTGVALATSSSCHAACLVFLCYVLGYTALFQQCVTKAASANYCSKAAAGSSIDWISDTLDAAFQLDSDSIISCFLRDGHKILTCSREDFSLRPTNQGFTVSIAEDLCEKAHLYARLHRGSPCTILT